MTQEERWQIRYDEVVEFIETNHRNPSKHDDQERYRYCNWLKHNKKLYNSGALKEERVEAFKRLMEENKHVNQWDV